MNKRIFYLGLEKVENRYTGQLSHEWFPDTFNEVSNVNLVHILGNDTQSRQIRVGEVFDATGRGKYALDQCSKFLDMIEAGEVATGDVLYLADYWHPGIEAIFYALDQYNIKLRVYARCWAQSVDEYDFTYDMRHWMRFYELGLDRYLSGIFVGSTIHRDQLKAAGFQTPIHVLSLPLHADLMRGKCETAVDVWNTDKTVVYASRYDQEKNPYFMMAVAKKFLGAYPDWEWHCCASSNGIRSNLVGVADAMHELSMKNPRFKVCTGLSKTEYYDKLARSKIIFNSALQDYVSWTILEATQLDCDVVYPDFRSFSEFVEPDRLYRPFNVDSAIETLKSVIKSPKTHHSYGQISDIGRITELVIMRDNITSELNIWHELERIKILIK